MFSHPHYTSCRVITLNRPICTSFKTPTPPPNPQVVSLLGRVLRSQIPGWSPERTLLGTSFCPDEISNEKGDLPHLLQEMFGKVFPFSGLAGIPFTGRTGFKTFASHVPRGDTVLIVYGPHVAISPTGEVGKCKRAGQDYLTSACGACMGALATIERGDYEPPSPGSPEFREDFQMNYIIEELSQRLDKITVHPQGKQVGLVYQAFAVAQQLIRTIVNVDIVPGSPVVLLGGVQINMPDPLPDFYLPLCFKRFTQEHRQGESWMDSIGAYPIIE